MLIVSNPGVLMSPEKARELAESLNCDEEDGWSYEAVDCRGGKYASIRIYDESGEFVGKL